MYGPFLKELPDATAGPTLLGDINHIGKAVIRRYGAAYRVVQVLVPIKFGEKTTTPTLMKLNTDAYPHPRLRLQLAKIHHEDPVHRPYFVCVAVSLLYDEFWQVSDNDWRERQNSTSWTARSLVPALPRVRVDPPDVMNLSGSRVQATLSRALISEAWRSDPNMWRTRSALRPTSEYQRSVDNGLVTMRLYGSVKILLAVYQKKSDGGFLLVLASDGEMYRYTKFITEATVHKGRPLQDDPATLQRYAMPTKEQADKRGYIIIELAYKDSRTGQKKPVTWSHETLKKARSPAGCMGEKLKQLTKHNVGMRVY